MPQQVIITMLNSFLFLDSLYRNISMRDNFNSHILDIQKKYPSRLWNQLTCKLRLRKKIKTKVEMVIQEQQEKFGESNADHADNKKGTKQKQKTVGEVIQKVALWRKLYTGFPSQTGKIVHYELDAAARQIGVIKKTLDDYLLQIRNGKRHGYNFNKNRNGKIGQLRSFVREKKQKQTKQKQQK